MIIILKKITHKIYISFLKNINKNYSYIIIHMNKNIVIKFKKGGLESINGSSSLYYLVNKIEKF